MSLPKAALCLSALLVLSGCGDDDPSPPNPAEDPKLSSVTVTCAPASVTAGQSTQCAAAAKDQKGQPFTVAGFTWTSTNTAVATVDGVGKVTALVQGDVTIQASATAKGVTQQGQAPVMVTASLSSHDRDITSNETWRAENNPHVVSKYIQVSGGSTLTLEAGVQVQFQAGTALYIDGVLQAVGTEAQPIQLTASPGAAAGSWNGLVLGSSQGGSSMSHVTLSGCGHAGGRGACLTLVNQAVPVLKHVSVRDSATIGVLVADDGSAFGAGSEALSVSGSKGYAVRIAANTAGTLPVGGTFSGNTNNAVELFSGAVTATQTWPALGIPYVATASIHIGGDSTPKLTLLAGTEVRVGAGLEISVGATKPGALIAVGTATSMIRFVPEQTPPVPGLWRGLQLWFASGTKLDYVVVSHAGTNVETKASNLNVYNEIGPFITNSTISDSRACGVSVNVGAIPGTTPVKTNIVASMYKNTFTNNQDGLQCLMEN
ncbi:Ig-like domain-containing protein [Stigmatella hybrida]|uniref:Ig-like domain-containing protein n=1 Tax=Stigmatella hybrida TaxID=394097 RepID=UPI001CDAAE07|nr:Ig-like domain-containing protein [Stigmatella hybrida]